MDQMYEIHTCVVFLLVPKPAADSIYPDVYIILEVFE